MGTVSKIRSRVRDSLSNVINGLGTSKDPRTAYVYGFSPLDRQQLEAAYRSEWIARKIVDAPAEDATREWREWQASQEQIQKLEDGERALDLKRQLRRALVKARLYGGSAIVMGVANQGLSEEPMDPELVGEGDLKFIAVFHQYELTPGQRIRDINSPWFNQPEYFQLATDVENIDPGQKISSGVRIHPSRVIQLTGHELPDVRLLAGSTNIWGDSVLQVVDDALKSTGAVIGGIATMITDAKMDVIKVPGLTAKLADDEKSSDLIKRFTLANTMKSSVNTLLLDEKEDWSRITTTFAGLPLLIQEYLTIAAGAAGIPVSRLLGMSKGKGLGGSEGGGEVDVRNYYDDISSMQRNELSPTLTPLDNVFIASVLGSRDEDIYYDWTPLWQLSDTEKAAIALQKGQTAQLDVTMALINPDVLRTIRINQLIEDGTYPGIQDAIDEHGEEPPEPQTPSPEDVQAHIGMMQRSASTLQSIGKSAGLAPPNPQDNGGWLKDEWSDAARQAAIENRRRNAKGKPDDLKSGNGQFDKTWYHGTTSEILDDVAKNGITVGADKRVWIASNKSTASFFAENKTSEGAHPVVFEVNVPKNEAKSFKALNFDKTHSTASSEHKIPPEWIAGYHLVDKKTGKMSGTLKKLPRAAKDAAASPAHPQLAESPYVTHYVVLLAKEGTEA